MRWTDFFVCLGLLLVFSETVSAADTNKDQVRREIRSRHNKVIFGKEIDHAEYVKFFGSLSLGPAAVAAYLETLASSILNETGQAVAKETVFDLVLGKKENTLVGNQLVYVKVATYNHWTIVGGLRIPLPNTHQFYIAIGKKKTDLPDGKRSVASMSSRFRAVNDWASRNNFPAGFPNFQEAVYDKVQVYGAKLFVPDAVEWRDIPVSELGKLDPINLRFSKVHDWATRKGFRSGYPNFHEAVYAGNQVIGVWLVKDKFADVRDVRAEDLGNPKTFEARIQAVDHWATKNGYVAGFPNGHESIAEGKTVYGCVLLKKGTTVHRDIPVTDLLPPSE